MGAAERRDDRAMPAVSIRAIDTALEAGIQAFVRVANHPVTVAFDAPTKEWAARHNPPTINAYLYDIRQDMARRQWGRVEVLNKEGVTDSRVQVPRWFRLSYMLTAWTKTGEEEHDLLTDLLRLFLGADTLTLPAPSEVESRGGVLKLPIALATPPPQDRSISDVWSALGGELKPSLDLGISVPFVPGREIEVGPPTLGPPRVTTRPMPRNEPRPGELERRHAQGLDLDGREPWRHRYRTAEGAAAGADGPQEEHDAGPVDKAKEKPPDVRAPATAERERLAAAARRRLETRRKESEVASQSAPGDGGTGDE